MPHREPLNIANFSGIEKNRQKAPWKGLYFAGKLSTVFLELQ